MDITCIQEITFRVPDEHKWVPYRSTRHCDKTVRDGHTSMTASSGKKRLSNMVDRYIVDCEDELAVLNSMRLKLIATANSSENVAHEMISNHHMRSTNR